MNGEGVETGGREGTMRRTAEMDDACLAILHAVRVGDLVGADKATDKLERLYAYAGVGPTRAGFENLLHVLRTLYTRRIASADRRTRAIPSLVAVEEHGSYEPSESRVTDQTRAAAALAVVKGEPPIA